MTGLPTWVQTHDTGRPKYQVAVDERMQPLVP